MKNSSYSAYSKWLVGWLINLAKCLPHLSLFVNGGIKSLISSIANGWVSPVGGSPIGKSPIGSSPILNRFGCSTGLRLFLSRVPIDPLITLAKVFFDTLDSFIAFSQRKLYLSGQDSY